MSGPSTADLAHATPTNQEVVNRAEHLYRPIAPGLIVANCGDGRHPVETLLDLYTKKFGGRDGFSWDIAVLQELYSPGFITNGDKDWSDVTESAEKYFERAQIQADVHSDEHAEGEGAKQIDTTKKDGAIGCGRLGRGSEIGTAFAENVEPIIGKMKELAPELLEGRESRVRHLAAVNARLVTLQLPDGRPFLLPGRTLALKSIERGAKGIVLAGEHEEEAAVYNLTPNTTNDNTASGKLFGADGWVTQRLFERNKEELPFDMTDVLLQDIGISLATKLVLEGTIDNVGVRGL